MRATLTEILASSQIGEEEQTADGRRILRCRVPLRFPMPEGGATVARTRDTRGPDEDAAVDGEVVWLRGVASSTSVDWYGTEMSKHCLDQMAEQMTAGVPILPRHPSWSGEGGEWDDEMGRTTKASVEMMPVGNPHEDSAGEQYVLTFEAELDADDAKVQSLERRAKRGQPIGTSIGGWMLRVIFEEDDDGDISRVIVDDIKLDHHALTRSPANPDANYIEVFRSLTAARPSPVVAPTRRAVTAFADLPVYDDHAEPWDAAAARDAILGDEPGDAEWARFGKAHVWIDEDKAETRAAYKLPIAKPDGKGALRVPWRAVTSAMGAVHGARGGVDIPESDKRKAHDHLARYYDKFGEEAPEFEDAMEGEEMEESIAVADPAEPPNPDGPAAEETPLEIEHHEERGEPAPGEDDMEPTALALLQSLAAKVDALEARTAAPVVSPEDKIAALQARNEELEAEVRATRDRPNVRGVATVRDTATNKVRVLKGRPAQVHRAMTMAEASGQAPLLREVLSDSSAKLLCAYDPHRAMKPEEKGLDARQILCDALNAADEDGSLSAWRN